MITSPSRRAANRPASIEPWTARWGRRTIRGYVDELESDGGQRVHHGLALSVAGDQPPFDAGSAAKAPHSIKDMNSGLVALWQ